MSVNSPRASLNPAVDAFAMLLPMMPRSADAVMMPDTEVLSDIQILLKVFFWVSGIPAPLPDEQSGHLLNSKLLAALLDQD